jgi:protein-tyrosine phosphatase
MTSILMVCLGNICRSPLAQGILESKLPSHSFYVDSAGTANYHAGNPPDSRSIAIAQSNGISISNQTARPFKVSDFDTFNIIYAMDNSNLKNIAKLARNMSDLAKVKLILEIDERAENKNVPDPYYNEFSGFKIVFQLLDNATSIIANQLLK